MKLSFKTKDWEFLNQFTCNLWHVIKIIIIIIIIIK